MLKDLANDPTVTATNYKHSLWIRVARKREMCNHLLVTEGDVMIDKCV
jgi:hypothetical protein